MESMTKSNILSWLPIFVGLLQSYLVIQSAQLAQSIYSTLWWAVYWMSLGIIPFSNIFLTVLFDILTNKVSYLALHLFKCVALMCIYIIVIINLLIYMCDFNSIMYVFSHITGNIHYLCLLFRTLTIKNCFLTCKVTILTWHKTLKKYLSETKIVSFNKVFNSLSLCFVYLVLLYQRLFSLDVHIYIRLKTKPNSVRIRF